MGDEGIMKRISLLVLSLALLLVAGCSDKPKDEFAQFRDQPSRAIFNSGEQSLAKENYADAVKYLEALDAIYPFGKYSEQGRLDIIYAYYKSEDYESAMAAADRYIHLYPRSRHVDYAYYMRGVTGFRVGLSWLQKQFGTDASARDISTLQQSFSAFATLAEEFPDSRYAKDGIVRMTYIRNLVAKREVDTAKFYEKRSAYIAAANRASYVVQHFEGSPQVVPALAIMVESYKKLGLVDLANNTYKMLAVSYPNSKELRQLH